MLIFFVSTFKKTRSGNTPMLIDLQDYTEEQ